MRRMTTPPRRGFTLVELLTVIAILALLAAIATAAFLRARGGAEISATESTLQKLRSGMDKRWKAVLDDAAQDISGNRIPEPTRTALFTFAQNDKDRARAIWTYCKLKNEFPTTVAEACNPVSIPVFDFSTGTQTGTQLVLGPKSVYTAGLKVTGASGVSSSSDPYLQSAVLLQWALTQTATRGETFELDAGVAQQTGDGGSLTVTTTSPAATGTLPAKVFKDAWGNPIAFIRQNYADELSDPVLAPKLGYAKLPVRDPADPQARLVTYTPGGWSQQALNAFWTTLNATPHVGLNGANLLAEYATYPTYGTGAAATPRNWMPTVVSAGVNKVLWKANGANFGADDDLFSFRLARDSKGN